MGMAGKAEDNFKGTLPKEFMQLGMSVYQDFDKIAADAESIKDPKHTLQQLSQSMGKCVACHATYQIDILKTSPSSQSPRTPIFC
jgi:ATP phosphoribosyltransferase regulatory subunit HisZ